MRSAMSDDRVLPGFPAVLWEQDYADRMNPALVTQILGDVVPAVRWTGWQLTHVEEGKAQSLLPLTDESTNQHGTHQAAMLTLSADYTGGSALASLIRGVPVLGIHPQVDHEGCALWSVQLDMKYLLPSAAPVTAHAEIPAERWNEIRTRYLEGRSVLEEVEVKFIADGQLVAVGRCRYFLKRASKLEPKDLQAPPHPIFAHRTKASARLIAGLRAQESQRPDARINDPWADTLAGPHGAFLARRFGAILPPLRDMVVARTMDVDRLVAEHAAAGVRQFVIVGVGFDMRPARLLASHDCTVFELDLPHMLEERARLLTQLQAPPVRRVPVPYNLQRIKLSEALGATTFRRDEPAVVIIEGVSMYQPASVMRAFLDDLAQVLAHPGSVAWIDVVQERALVNSGNQAAEAFITGMQKLGEPFIFGVDDPAEWVKPSGLQVLRRVPSVPEGTQGADPIFGFYDFLHLGRR